MLCCAVLCVCSHANITEDVSSLRGLQQERERVQGVEESVSLQEMVCTAIATHFQLRAQPVDSPLLPRLSDTFTDGGREGGREEGGRERGQEGERERGIRKVTG